MNESVVSTRVLPGILSFLLAFSAEASILSFDYSGAIVTSPDGIVPLGTRFSGSFLYDDGLVGSSNAGGTVYSPVDFSLSIDGTNINFPAVINIDNDSTFTVPGHDVIQIGRFGIIPNPVLNSFALEGIEIDLLDNSETALSDESLPLTFDLADWPVTGRTLVISPFGSINYTLGRIETLESTVPIPASVWLFGSGLLGLVGIARRKKQ